MRKKILLLVIVLWVTSISNVFAASSSSLEKLDTISDKALEFAKQYRFEESKGMLQFFSKQFMQTNAREQLFGMDELRIITVAYDDAVQAVTNKDMPDAERVRAVTKLRLAMDAVEKNHDPLWTALEEQVMTTFAESKSALVHDDSDQFEVQINQLTALYDMLYPSLKMDLSPETFQELDARMNYITTYQPVLFTDKTSLKELEVLEQDFKTIFDKTEEDDADPSLWWVIITTGSIIISTLSYVGWRKYTGTRFGKTRKEQDD